MKSLFPALLVFGGATLVSQLSFSERAIAQNYIPLNSQIVERCKIARTFDAEYRVGGGCNFFHVTAYFKGKFSNPIVNNSSGWILLETPSGKPIGICYRAGTKVHPNLYGYQCQDEVSQPQTTWQNSGNTGYYNQTPVQQRPTFRVCANTGTRNTTSVSGKIGDWRLNTSTTTYQNGNGCNY